MKNQEEVKVVIICLNGVVRESSGAWRKLKPRRNKEIRVISLGPSNTTTTSTKPSPLSLFLFLSLSTHARNTTTIDRFFDRLRR